MNEFPKVRWLKVDGLPVDIDLWAQFANCRGMSANDFHPDKKGPGVFKQEVIDACNNCIVRYECAEWAIQYEEHGYWGGMTSYQRRHERARRNIFVRDSRERHQHGRRVLTDAYMASQY